MTLTNLLEKIKRDHDESQYMLSCYIDETKTRYNELLKALEIAIKCLEKYELEAIYHEHQDVAEAPKAIKEIEAVLKGCKNG